VDIAPDCEIQITTKGFTGKNCVSETQFLKDLLGTETEKTLYPVYFVENEQENKQFVPLCG
jgi:hypothetical protein